MTHEIIPNVNSHILPCNDEEVAAQWNVCEKQLLVFYSTNGKDLI